MIYIYTHIYILILDLYIHIYIYYIYIFAWHVYVLCYVPSGMFVSQQELLSPVPPFFAPQVTNNTVSLLCRYSSRLRWTEVHGTV